MTCPICGSIGPDLRTLQLRYLYDLTEASDKLTLDEKGFYNLTTCKNCRANFIEMFRRFCNGEFIQRDQDNPERTIPVRVDGATAMMTETEYYAYRHQQARKLHLRS